ncbi:hypothetical protein, conserved [Entamoeba dispar SAW760]|uniref:Leucine rich repeat containing protein BspA family protein n=1 Tax=Entamoeba dispar (strain ATCC PRA-260 / SAW760) TaxID=370354 RepID=B0EL24_ENTDS|nr:uncharacterized protein EDI_196300 [Entamoeba dispar SAW760]EDR24786.1 hypothetical protein, conserved [Entamoeba dispar SAW760]|eukprot:EDR24786.1 hypothetical protein, conserved [Entamoeba dispar SAW760]
MGKDKEKTKDIITEVPKRKVKLTVEEVMRVLDCFVKKEDFIRSLQISKKFKDIPKRYSYNPISIDSTTISLFPNLKVQKLYAWNDTQIPKMKKYEVEYPETYFHYYLKYFAIRDKVSARKIVYSSEDRVNYECMKGEGILPDGITKIADKCFEECNKIVSLNIPTSVTAIGRNGFANCTSLTSLTLPENLMVIGDNCFLACNSLTSIKLGTTNCFKGKASYGIYLFLEKNNIHCNDVFYSSEDRRKYGNKIPEICNSLADKCFASCLSLTSIEVPSTIQHIGSRCFEGCKGLKQISLPPTINCYDHAFSGCSYITALTLPGNFPKIDKSIFENIQMIKSIVLTDCTQFDGLVSYSLAVIIERGGIPCTNVAYTEEDRKVFGENIPKGVKEVGDNCFSGDFRAKSITVPKGVTKLGQSCFKNCCSLTSVSLPSSIISIPVSCFYQCPVLKTLKIKNKTLTYEKYCFYGCEKLKLKSKNIPSECFSKEPQPDDKTKK